MRHLADYCSSIDYGYTTSAVDAPIGPKLLRITDIVNGGPIWGQVPHCRSDASASDKFRLYDGDIVIARTGATTGVSAFISDPPDALFASYLVRLKIDTAKADARFVSYYLKGPEYWDFVRGVLGDKSAQPNASARTLTRAPAHFPSLPEQQSIAAVLGALDDKIEQNRRTSQELEGIARMVFRAWFVDFEPVKAKAAGATSFPSMPQAVFDSLSGELVASTIGMIPLGWELKALTDICAVNPPRSIKSGKTAPYLDMKNMPTDGHAPDLLSLRMVGSGARFTNGDTLVARITPCLENGKTAFVDCLRDDEVGWGSTEYIVLRPHSPLPPIFAYLLARTAEFRSYAIQAMTGTSGRQRVPFSAFEHFHVPQPTATIARAFSEVAEPLIERSSAALHESRALAALRDYLLPRLLSGQLRISQGEAS